MTGPSWLVDGRIIAKKIINPPESYLLAAEKSKNNPTRACPKCNHIIDNSDVSKDWPGLPRGVKFDPSDPELVWHLLAKVGEDAAKPHPFINDFIPTLEGDDGICYTHPQKLPGVKQDGSVSHFFHRTFKAYGTGTRKRRKIINDDIGDVRWHITGKTKPVVLDGIQKGCKKIMVLYVCTTKGKKKTNWVMHQYHLGVEEEEKDGEYVVSKVFYQQQGKQYDKIEEDPHLEIPNTGDRENEATGCLQMVTPEPPKEKQPFDVDREESPVKMTEGGVSESKADCITIETEKTDDNDNHSLDPKWWESESQSMDSQELALALAMCEEFLQSQSSCGDHTTERNKPCLSDYARLGAECLKRDLEECMKQSNLDDPDIVQGTPTDLRLSQLVSQPSCGDHTTERNKPCLSDYARLGAEYLKRDLEDCMKQSNLDDPDIVQGTPTDLRLSQLEFGSQDGLL